MKKYLLIGLLSCLAIEQSSYAEISDGQSFRCGALNSFVTCWIGKAVGYGLGTLYTGDPKKASEFATCGGVIGAAYSFCAGARRILPVISYESLASEPVDAKKKVSECLYGYGQALAAAAHLPIGSVAQIGFLVVLLWNNYTLK